MNDKFKDPVYFSEFIQRLKAGNTSSEEDIQFEQALKEMSETIERISSLARDIKS